MTAKNAKCANGSDSNNGQIILHFGLMLVVVECPSIVHSRSGAVSRCIFLFFRTSAANNKEPTHFSPQFVLVFLFVVVWPLLNRWNELLARIGEAERLTQTALIRPTTAAYTKMRWIANAYFYLSLRTRNRSHSFFFFFCCFFPFSLSCPALGFYLLLSRHIFCSLNCWKWNFIAGRGNYFNRYIFVREAFIICNSRFHFILESFSLSVNSLDWAKLTDNGDGKMSKKNWAAE